MRNGRHEKASKWIVAFALTALCPGFLGTESIAQTARSRDQTRPAATASSPRTCLSLNQSWRFTAADTPGAEAAGFDDSQWQVVSVPHTWNALDTEDDEPSYRLGVGWYRRLLDLDHRLKGKRLFLYFEGANQVADVFVNGKLAGQHKGGYTAFAFEITEWVTTKPGERNVIAVKVDNSIDPEIPPAPSADFNLYGGIYRDVWLIATEPVHLNVLDHASPGVYLDTPAVSAASATVAIRGSLVNSTNKPRQIRVVSTVLDAVGQRVTAVESITAVAAGREANFRQSSDPIPQPHLWSPDSPYLYTVRTQLYDGPRLVDQIENPLGFRWFTFDANLGFFLNGKRLKLRGTNRHQDHKGLGNAVSNELQVKDLETIKATGMNCVLLAHYPHDPAVLEAADRLGLIVWEEVPIVREISTTDEFAQNCKTMLTEMIRQHYNHPSIIMWCYMNEIFLSTRNELGYVRQVVALARALEELVHQEDPARITVISANRPYSNDDIYNASGLLDIPDVVGWHMYFGWYYGAFRDLGGFLDDQHRRFPKRKIFISEYGADNDRRIHSLKPLIGDGSVEWAHLYHTNYVTQIEARPYLAGSAVWVQNDFGSEARGGFTPHVNTKGLFNYDRQPKDIYYYYKALFSSEPVLHLATRDWAIRLGTNPASHAGEARLVTQPVEIFTNLAAVELFLNGKSLGSKRADESRHLSWDVPFRNGINVVEARGVTGPKSISDKTNVRFTYRLPVLADPAVPFENLAINVGSNAQFIDSDGAVWEADQSYKAGSWGYVGGAPGRASQNVLGSTEDPLYQTVRQGLNAYRCDVPDGTYEVKLLFLEHRFTKIGERVFSVALNGKTVIDKLDLVKDYGAMRAASRNFQVRVEHGQGVAVEFTSVVGDSVLSAILVRKLH